MQKAGEKQMDPFSNINEMTTAYFNYQQSDAAQKQTGKSGAKEAKQRDAFLRPQDKENEVPTEDYRSYRRRRQAEERYWEEVRLARKRRLKKQYKKWLEQKAFEKARLQREWLENTALLQREKEKAHKPWNEDGKMSAAALAYEANLRKAKPVLDRMGSRFGIKGVTD